MSVADPYNAEVRRRFENPVNAGTPEGEYDRVIEAASSESSAGARIVLFAGLKDGKIASLRFRAKGCPHLIAAADFFCSRLEGLEPSRLDEVRSPEFFAPLEVPVEKTGRLLLVEDAARKIQAEAGDGTPGK